MYAVPLRVNAAESMWSQIRPDPEKIRTKQREEQRKRENILPSEAARFAVAAAQKEWIANLLEKDTAMVRKKLAVSLQLPTLSKSLAQYFVNVNVES
eukprot:4155494-Pleurochrysis_carterae.AAC.1